MTSKEFTFWLAGFLEASGTYGLQKEQVNKIMDTLKNVKDMDTLKNVEDKKSILLNPKYPCMPIAPDTSNEKLVPHNTICSCNPANGGNGICGCIMGNKLVPRDRKSNIYTTTSENTPFNWQYQNTDKSDITPNTNFLYSKKSNNSNIQILHD
jgi:hypothetical protein